MKLKFTIEVCDFLYCCKHDSKYNRTPSLVGKNPKQQLKFMVHQNKIYGFLLQVPITHVTILSKIACLKIPPLFSKTLSFLTIPNLFIMIKTNKNSKFKLTFPNQSLF